jgi:hypothetical protein
VIQIANNAPVRLIESHVSQSAEFVPVLCPSWSRGRQSCVHTITPPEKSGQARGPIPRILSPPADAALVTRMVREEARKTSFEPISQIVLGGAPSAVPPKAERDAGLKPP